jgi:hypothetical protein
VARNTLDKGDFGVDIAAAMLTIGPFKVGMGIGILILIYGTMKMEWALGALGFFLCFLAGIVGELFR